MAAEVFRKDEGETNCLDRASERLLSTPGKAFRNIVSIANFLVFWRRQNGVTVTK